MELWLLVAILILVAAVFMALLLTRSSKAGQRPEAIVSLAGFLTPLLYVLLFSRSLFAQIPGLTTIDVGALLFMGGISGFFLHAWLTNRPR